MFKRKFGKTGVEVSPIGLGTGEIGVNNTDQQECDRLLNGVLDIGINVIDTAECYEDSEIKIGNSISSRRAQYFLITKCGHRRGELQSPEWSAPLVTESVKRSLKRLKTDCVDLVLLHSCDKEKLRDQEMLDALVNCKQSGKTRLIGYSGDAEAAMLAVGMDIFDALETSVNIADQQLLGTYLPQAGLEELGVIAKRPLANSAWRINEKTGFYRSYANTYAERLKAMGMSPAVVGFNGDWYEMAMRFAAFQPNVSTAIVGSTNLEHIKQDIEMLEKGPLEAAVVTAIRALWRQHDHGHWAGQT